MTLAWDALNELDAYRITEIPRRSDADAAPPGQDRPGDPGRTQRLAALIAAYHVGAEAKENGSSALAIGWIRHSVGGPVQVLVAGAALVGSEAGQEVFLTLPGGARGQPLLRGTMATLMAQLPSWRTIGGISDGLLPDNERRPGDRPPPSMEECLLAVWPGPFGWLLLAEPLSTAEIQAMADELAQLEQYSTGNSDRFPERAMATRRLSLRHAEMRKGSSAGLWRVRLLAGGTSAEAASRVAGLVCASADLDGLPYAVTPAGSAARSLREVLEEPSPAPAGGDAVSQGIPALVAASSSVRTVCDFPDPVAPLTKTCRFRESSGSTSGPADLRFLSRISPTSIALRPAMGSCVTSKSGRRASRIPGISRSGGRASAAINSVLA